MKREATTETVEQPRTLVVGLGVTGLSCARFFASRGVDVVVTDSREHPPGLEALQQQYPGVPVYTGEFNKRAFAEAERIIVSPGVPLTQLLIRQAIERGAEVMGDIDLFLELAEAPVVAITGSNGKSTVTTLLGEMAKADDKVVAVGGNLGTPVLDILDSRVELYVLELSSFQLELVHRLKAAAAVVLNISADHMDRYESIDDYADAKAVVYRNASVAVVNLDDALAATLAETGRKIGFTLDMPVESGYGICGISSEQWLCKGDDMLMPVSELRVAGRHNQANVLAALALGDAVGLKMAAMLEAARGFTGLAHRAQFVAEKDGVRWYNDSKGTNVGACVAALEGLQPNDKSRTVLIAGGDCKGADFTELEDALSRYVRAVVLIGRDAPMIAAVVGEIVPAVRATDMNDAVIKAASMAIAGDRILLSPACASFDMFDNYEQRGEVFMESVRRLVS